MHFRPHHNRGSYNHYKNRLQLSNDLLRYRPTAFAPYVAWSGVNLSYSN